MPRYEITDEAVLTYLEEPVLRYNIHIIDLSSSRRMIIVNSHYLLG